MQYALERQNKNMIRPIETLDTGKKASWTEMDTETPTTTTTSSEMDWKYPVSVYFLFGWMIILQSSIITQITDYYFLKQKKLIL